MGIQKAPDEIRFLIEGTLKATLFYGMRGKAVESSQKTIDKFIEEAVPIYDSQDWTITDVQTKFREWFGTRSG